MLLEEQSYAIYYLRSLMLRPLFWDITALSDGSGMLFTMIWIPWVWQEDEARDRKF